MVGTPVRRAMVKDIEARGGEEWVLAQIANGETVTSVSRQLKVSRDLLAKWLNSDPKRKERLQQARIHMAYAIADQILDISDNVEETHEAIAKARLRTESRKWLAGRYAPEIFGEQKTASINLTIGDLHLQALKAINQEDKMTDVIDVDPTQPSQTQESDE